MTSRTAMIAGAILAAAAVASGAYGAHGLEKKLVELGFESDLSKRLGWYETAVKYHFYHAMGLIIVGLVAERREAKQLLKVAAALLVVGIALFSGSLYAMTFLGPDWSKLGAITPLGGLSFIVGWILIAIAAYR